MTITPSQFKTNFSPFANPANYPDAVVQFYLDLAYSLLPASRWQTTLDYGVQLFAAHNLILEFQAQVAANGGRPPGLSSGIASSKSAGPVSISWDTSSAAEIGAGHWNLTTYGQRYIRLARLIGSGGMQLGIGSPPPLSGGNAWYGPPVIWPGWQ